MTAAGADMSLLAAKPDKGRSLWADAWFRFRRRKLAMMMLWIVGVYVVLALAVFFGFLAANWDQPVVTSEFYEGPAWSRLVVTDAQGKALEEHEQHRRIAPELWFGTDIFGQSVLRKTIYGAKISLTVAFLASLLSIAIGVPMGAIAGYFGGLVDEIIVWLYSTLSSIPGFLLILAFAFVLRERLPGITSVYVALGLTSWVGLCRLMRGEVLKHKNRDYVAAAMVYGASRPRIIFKHIIPNVTHLILIDFSLRFVGFVHAEVILSYLGLGPKEQPSWGTMINEAKQELTRNPSVWWQLAAAAVAVLILSLALNVAGDAMRDALDPKLRHVA